MDDLANLKRGLKTEVELALAGETGRSVVLLLREQRLPLACITDARGVVIKKVVSYVDLLAALDGSSVVEGLKREATRTTRLPPLPKNTMFVDLVEKPSGNSYVLTGWVEPREHLFVLEMGEDTTTHEIPLPHVVWRAVWHEEESTLSALSIALCSPDLNGGEPTADTQTYRWPFSNVYAGFGGVFEGVCWPTMRRMKLSPAEIPEKAVLGFVGMPNNGDLYGRGLSHNAPHEGYRELLEAIERGGLEHDHLIPTGLTVKDLHDQKGRKT